MKFIPSILLPVAFATSALAHGFVSRITVDGKVYKGNTPNGDENPSIIRLISTTSPVKGATNPDVNCGSGAPHPATDVGNAMPGSKLEFTWDAGDGENWPHNTGPLMTYMASCGSTTCDKFDSTKAKWFKIDQQGRNASGDWIQADIMAGQPVRVTLPDTLAPGNYLIRHEIIALHLATSMGGAEFYPSCSQFTVGGSQTGAPTDKELVSFPGAYSDSDPGIFDPDVFNSGSPYTFPGPPIAAFVSGSSSSSGSATTGTSASGTSASGTATTTSAPTATSTKSSGTCKLKRKASSSSLTVAASIIRPRHLSRIMRGLIANHALSL
ncbi:Cellulose-growth-specific protein [Termitomyces sp. J132]|nr:hypothetical protein H2248_003490 [Termitomyces sp. 'cryptogamus']KNZ76498.1 Cellulose-growth-specific protein [Termitomyces sp. J132]